MKLRIALLDFPDPKNLFRILAELHYILEINLGRNYIYFNTDFSHLGTHTVSPFIYDFYFVLPKILVFKNFSTVI